MATLKTFTRASARQLPVILLADVSGSMGSEGKISALNDSISQMLESFADSDGMRAEIQVAVITFGGTAALKVPLAAARNIVWEDMQAYGGTPLGAALSIADALVMDDTVIMSRAYRPTIVLMSDGQPTDDWKGMMTKFTKEGRSSKAHRMALAIGMDADEAMLRAFIDDPKGRLFYAEDARRIKDFFRMLTMSVGTRSISNNPNQIPVLEDPFANLDF